MLAGREWDLDLIEENPDNDWRLKAIENFEIHQDENLGEMLPLIYTTGTIVLLRKLDRYDGLEKKLNSLIEQTRVHLELVFHRFLSPSPGKKKVNIFLNNDPLTAFNPFNPSHTATQELPEQFIHVDEQAVKIQPYVLPHYNKTSRDDYQKYSCAGGYLQNQGFYVYRNRRLIIKGTWFRLIKKEELTKLIRVQVDIPNSLDHLWKIDVKKSHASPPEAIRTDPMVWSLALEGKSDHDRFKELGWGFCTWDNLKLCPKKITASPLKKAVRKKCKEDRSAKYQ